MTAAFVDCLNLSTFSQNLAQYRPYTKPIVTFTMQSSSESKRARVRYSNGPMLCRKQVLADRVWARIGRQVHTKVIIPATARYWQNRSSEHFCRCWASVGPYLTSYLDFYNKRLAHNVNIM